MAEHLRKAVESLKEALPYLKGPLKEKVEEDVKTYESFLEVLDKMDVVERRDLDPKLNKYIAYIGWRVFETIGTNWFIPREVREIGEKALEELVEVDGRVMGELRSPNSYMYPYIWYQQLFSKGFLERRLVGRKKHEYRFIEERADFLKEAVRKSGLLRLVEFNRKRRKSS